MYPVDNATKALFEGGSRQVVRITGLKDTSNNSVTLTEANIVQGGFVIDRHSCNSNKLEIASTIAAQLTLTLYNGSGSTLDSVKFDKDAEMKVEVGTANWEASSPSVTYIPMGYFIIQKVERKRTSIVVTALDRMIKFQTLVGSRDSGRWIEITGPAWSIASYGWNHAGVPMGMTYEQYSALPNATYRVKYVIDKEIQCYELIKLFAYLTGTVAYIDYNGNLQFGWYRFPVSSPQYYVDDSKRYSTSLTWHEAEMTLDGVRYVRQDGSVKYINPPSAPSGTQYGNNYLDIPYIPILDPADEDTVLGNIADADCMCDIGGTTVFRYFTPYTAEIVPAPWLFPLDQCSMNTGSGEQQIQYDTGISNVTFKLNNHTNIGLIGMGDNQENGVSTSTQDAIQEALYNAIVLCQASGAANTPVAMTDDVFTQIPLTVSTFSLGEGISVDDNGVKVEMDGIYRVSASLYMGVSSNSGITEKQVFIYQGTDYANASEIVSGTDVASGSLRGTGAFGTTPMIVTASKNDHFYLVGRSRGGSGNYYAGNPSTFLLVEKVDLGSVRSSSVNVTQDAVSHDLYIS